MGCHKPLIRPAISWGGCVDQPWRNWEAKSGGVWIRLPNFPHQGKPVALRQSSKAVQTYRVLLMLQECWWCALTGVCGGCDAGQIPRWKEKYIQKLWRILVNGAKFKMAKCFLIIDIPSSMVRKRYSLSMIYHSLGFWSFCVQTVDISFNLPAWNHRAPQEWSSSGGMLTYNEFPSLFLLCNPSPPKNTGAMEKKPGCLGYTGE